MIYTKLKQHAVGLMMGSLLLYDKQAKFNITNKLKSTSSSCSSTQQKKNSTTNKYHHHHQHQHQNNINININKKKDLVSNPRATSSWISSRLGRSEGYHHSLAQFQHSDQLILLSLLLLDSEPLDVNDPFANHHLISPSSSKINYNHQQQPEFVCCMNFDDYDEDDDDNFYNDDDDQLDDYQIKDLSLIASPVHRATYYNSLSSSLSSSSSSTEECIDTHSVRIQSSSSLSIENQPDSYSNNNCSLEKHYMHDIDSTSLIQGIDYSQPSSSKEYLLSTSDIAHSSIDSANEQENNDKRSQINSSSLVNNHFIYHHTRSNRSNSQSSSSITSADETMLKVAPDNNSSNPAVGFQSPAPIQIPNHHLIKQLQYNNNHQSIGVSHPAPQQTHQYQQNPALHTNDSHQQFISPQQHQQPHQIHRYQSFNRADLAIPRPALLLRQSTYTATSDTFTDRSYEDQNQGPPGRAFEATTRPLLVETSPYRKGQFSAPLEPTSTFIVETPDHDHRTFRYPSHQSQQTLIQQPQSFSQSQAIIRQNPLKVRDNDPATNSNRLHHQPHQQLAYRNTIARIPNSNDQSSGSGPNIGLNGEFNNPSNSSHRRSHHHKLSHRQTMVAFKMGPRTNSGQTTGVMNNNITPATTTGFNEPNLHYPFKDGDKQQQTIAPNPTNLQTPTSLANFSTNNDVDITMASPINNDIQHSHHQHTIQGDKTSASYSSNNIAISKPPTGHRRPHRNKSKVNTNDTNVGPKVTTNNNNSPYLQSSPFPIQNQSNDRQEKLEQLSNQQHQNQNHNQITTSQMLNIQSTPSSMHNINANIINGTSANTAIATNTGGLSQYAGSPFPPYGRPMIRTSHRTHSSWMRISSIICIPVGMIIVIFIVASPLLHYIF